MQYAVAADTEYDRSVFLVTRERTVILGIEVADGEAETVTLAMPEARELLNNLTAAIAKVDEADERAG